ncbi:MAG: MotA/TolQ/ExbB proton channel family protein [Elusimicrobiota bacterium]
MNRQSETVFASISISILISILICPQLWAVSTQMGKLGQIDLYELTRSSFVMIGLFLLSIVAFTFIVERSLYFKRIGVPPERIMVTIKAYLKEHNFDQITKWCERYPTPVSTTIKVIIENKDKTEFEIDELTEIVKVQQKSEMEKNMIVLSSSATVGPLLGLLGTVTGIIKAFSDLAKSGVGGPSVVAAGVSEALVATAFGLIIAVPSLLAYNFFANKIKNNILNVEINSKLIRLTLAEFKKTP